MLAASQHGGDAAAAAFRRLAARTYEQQDRAAARYYTLLGAVLHSQLCGRHGTDAAFSWRAIAEAAAAPGKAATPWLVAEAALLRCLVAATRDDKAAATAAFQQLLQCSGPPQSPLLWPPAAQPEGRGADQRLWVDPLASAVLVPPSSAATVVLMPPAEMWAQLPPQHQAMLLEVLLPTCSPAAAEAAVAIAQWVHRTIAASGLADAQQPLHRQPLLSWALSAAATALSSSIPAAAPHLWHQVSAALPRCVFWASRR